MKVIRDTWIVLGRYLERSVANPTFMGVSLAQPIVYLILFAPMLKSVARLHGFPSGGAYNVFVPGLLVQLGLFSVTSGGWGLLAEVRAGIIERMRVTPVSRLALLLGHTLRDIAMLLLQAAIIVTAALPFGLSLSLPGILVAFALVALIALLMSSTSYAIALQVGDENTFGAIAFSASLPLLLLSGVLLPISLAPDWLQHVAQINPLTYAVNAERALFANHLGDASVVKGFLFIGALSVIAVAAAARAFGKAVA